MPAPSGDCVNSVERVTGIEPALSAWEAEVLPLNYTRTATPSARKAAAMRAPVIIPKPGPQAEPAP
jgi:hypothetical protein